MIIIFQVLDIQGKTIGYSSSRTLTDDLAFGQGPLGTQSEIKKIEVWEYVKDLPADVSETILNKKIEAFEEFLKTLSLENREALIKRLTLPQQDFEDDIPF